MRLEQEGDFLGRRDPAQDDVAVGEAAETRHDVVVSLGRFDRLQAWLVPGEPADQTHILVSYVYKAVFNMYQYGYGAALSMVIFGILLVFSMLFLTKTKATEAVY